MTRTLRNLKAPVWRFAGVLLLVAVAVGECGGPGNHKVW